MLPKNIFLYICFIFALTACSENTKKVDSAANITVNINSPSTNAEDLKTVDYWLSHKDERNSYWMANCSEAMEFRDNCKVLDILKRDEGLARKTYESILDHRK